MLTPQTLNQAVQRLVQAAHPQKVILFGSQARGEADSRSDVDLLVVCSIQDNRRQMIIRLLDSLEGLDLTADVIVLTKEEFEHDKLIPGTVARPAWLEGRALYESG